MALTPFYRVAGYAFYAYAGWRKRWIGMENVPEGGFVLGANHLSNMDPFILGMPLWPRDRMIHWMAKAELYNRVLTKPLNWIGAFPVRRGEADTDAMRMALELLRSGEVIGMFPEGTRAKKGLRKTRVPKPHPGTARIALTAGVPLVPAAVAGTDKLLRFAPVTVAFGPPVEVGDLAGMPRRQAAEIATERLMEDIRRLAAQINGRDAAR